MLLDLHGVSQNFGGLKALSNVTLGVPAQRIVGLIGPNGAGKTTLINVISGLSHPTGGSITLDGAPLQHAAPHQITRLGIARTYQNIRLFGEMTALQNLMIAQHARGRASVLDAVIFSPRYRREERDHYQHAQRLLERFGLDRAGPHHRRESALWRSAPPGNCARIGDQAQTAAAG